MSLRPKHTGTSLPIRPFVREEIDLMFEELAAGEEVNYEAADREYVFKEEVINAISLLHEQVRDLEADVKFSKATMNLTISATNLTTTVVANDTLTCVSETPYEFSFIDSRRFTKVVAGPGPTQAGGVQPHRLIFDTARSEGDGDYPQAVLAASATTLRLAQWDGTVWQDVTWGIGWVVQITQYIDNDLPAITGE